MIKKRPFGNLNGKEVYAYTLEGDELCVTVIDYGAAIQSIKFRGRELTLGHDNLEDYVKRRSFFGATIGRVANRIGGARFSLNGKEYALDKNDGENFLHGGFDGYDMRLFESREDGGGVVFSLESADGDQGFCGKLKLKVVYSVIGNTLNIVYEATSDKDTLWNPTNHAFFNFSGTNAPIYDTSLTINADNFTPADAEQITTGEIRKVAGTPLDFTRPKPIGRDISDGYEQLKIASGGYDHNFVLKGNPAAVAELDNIRLEMHTDMKGLQLYTGNFLSGEICRGKPYGKHTAFCLEPQYFPNAVNIEGFETPLLCAGEVKTHYIKYIFS